VRSCAKTRCPNEAVATAGLTYERRQVVVGDLTPQANPNLFDLCPLHVERLRPPLGWALLDERTPEPARP
jgi:hypothetical protein